MPFTFFHPAAVTGLLRTPGLVPAGLVIGTMAPDFEYFLRLDTVARYTHTLPGLVYACVPLGLLALVLWQGVIRDPLVGALPEPLRSRVGGITSSGVPRTPAAWALAAVSVLIGAVTHLLWDSFTHPGYPPAIWLGLTAPSPIPGVPWTGVMQRGSDLIGCVVLVLVIGRLPVRPIPRPARPWLFWLVTAMVTPVPAGVRTLVQPGWMHLSTVIATLIAGGLLGLLVAALAIRATTPTAPAHAGRPRDPR